jgi:hypothetical protein
MSQTRRNSNKKPVSKIQIIIIVLSAIIIILLSVIILKGWFKDSGNDSVTKNTAQTTEEVSLSSSVSRESTETINSDTTENSVEAKYPKITKEVLNGKTWYEGGSTGVENQPREGFSENKFHDIFGNELDYEIAIDGKEQTYRILDFRKNEIVDIKLKTKIVVNKPTVDGTYRDVSYYLYYKYDGTLMIAQEGTSSEQSDLTSYPLEQVIN